MQMRRLATMLFCLLPMAAMMYGCGSSNKEGTGTLSTVATVGDTACVQCHSAAKDPVTGEGIVAQYNKSTHYLTAQGCESCHGGGAQHNGVGPIPYPIPDATRCATCHTGTNATVLQTALAMKPAKEDSTNPSNHANGGYEGVNTSERCYRCHTGEGAVLSNVAGYTGDANIINNNAYKLTQDRDFTKFKGINCSTCHEHGGVLRKVNTRDANGNVVVWDPNNNRKVDQFDLCTSCHTYQNPDGTLVSSGTAASGTKPATAPFYHNTAWYRTITSTHWDNPATGVGLPSTLIEGYVIRTTSANPCFDCHGHEAKTNTRPNTTPVRPSTIHTDWAKSAHAGGLLNEKIAASRNADGTWKASSTATVDAVMNAGVTGTSGPGWEHYNWDSTYTGTSGTTADRGYCQKCHTATGISNFLSNPSTYDQSGKNNNFSHLSGWKANGGSPQNELLYCWGCHSNAGKGTLRNPGAITLTFDADTAAPRKITLPDAKNSNVCVTCHGGRGGTGTVARSSRFVAHHAPAAGILYAKYAHGGYEFTGQTYFPSTDHFQHDTIGLDTGSGPCASCHMKSTNSHSYSVVTKDSAGKVTAINTAAVCNTCHTGNYALTAAKIEEESEGYQNAGTLLKAYVANTVANYLNLAITSTNVTNATTVPDNAYGAFQNSLLTTEEKGGFAHNRMYVKRLLFDSIDWMDNGKFDGTITVPSTYAAARAWFGADATGKAVRK